MAEAAQTGHSLLTGGMSLGGKASPTSGGRGMGGVGTSLAGMGMDASRALGAHDEDDEGATSAPLSYAQAMKLETLDRSSRLSHWMSAFAADEEAFASKAVLVEHLAVRHAVLVDEPCHFHVEAAVARHIELAKLCRRY